MTMTMCIPTWKYMIFLMMKYPKVGLQTMKTVFEVPWLLTWALKWELDLNVHNICGYRL